MSLTRPRHFLSYEAIALWVDAIAEDLRQQGFTAVVGLRRGGSFPALCVSFATGLPLVDVAYDRQSQRVRWVGDVPPAGKVLLCEDIAGSGVTLVNARRFIERTHAVATLTLVEDEFSSIKPDWAQRFEGFHVVFPWERHDQSPAHQRDWHQGGASGATPMAADHTYRRFGVDLDGVLCPDLPPEAYQQDLSATLHARDALALLSNAPPLSQEAHVIITGRPVEDRQRTEAWLARVGHAHITVVLREPRLHAEHETPVHKGQAATAHGCSDFIESCPRQAIEIAAHFPHLRVHWWNDGDPVVVSAQALRRSK